MDIGGLALGIEWFERAEQVATFRLLAQIDHRDRLADQRCQRLHHGGFACARFTHQQGWLRVSNARRYTLHRC